MNKLFEATSKLMKQENTKNIELANFLQVSAQVFGNWISRETVPEKYASKIAEYYKMDLNSLYDDEVRSVKKIPIIGKTDCGSGGDKHKIDAFALYKGDNKAEKLYCVTACGNNMSPEIEDGDEIICDPKAKIENGDIVHYKIESEDAVKIYVKDEDADILQLVPYIQSKDFKTKTIINESADIAIAKVIAVNKLKMKNTQARLKLIERA
jgi:phage repressor protein C with HTH and peptisase S24 domain